MFFKYKKKTNPLNWDIELAILKKLFEKKKETLEAYTLNISGENFTSFVIDIGDFTSLSEFSAYVHVKLKELPEIRDVQILFVKFLMAIEKKCQKSLAFLNLKEFLEAQCKKHDLLSTFSTTFFSIFDILWFEFTDYKIQLRLPYFWQYKIFAHNFLVSQTLQIPNLRRCIINFGIVQCFETLMNRPWEVFSWITSKDLWDQKELSRIRRFYFPIYSLSCVESKQLPITIPSFIPQLIYHKDVQFAFKKAVANFIKKEQKLQGITILSKDLSQVVVVIKNKIKFNFFLQEKPNND